MNIKLHLCRCISNAYSFSVRKHTSVKLCKTILSNVEKYCGNLPRRELTTCSQKKESVENLDKSNKHDGDKGVQDITDFQITLPSERLEQVEGTSIIGPYKEDISSFGPYFQPSFNFAAYVNKSATLQELVKLGVDLHRLEKRKDVPNFILKMDFDRDMREHIRFLCDVGVPPDELGTFFTKNPFIFKEDLQDLQVRINYLQSKRFTDEIISNIVRRNPYWLNFSTERIDRKLGHFQSTFKLTGDEVRYLTASQPRLITYKMAHIKVNTFSVKEEMGFDDREMKALLLKAPRLWMKNNKILMGRFDYVHNVMKLSHEQILDFPQILKSRTFHIKQRHLFLATLGRAQYDPNLEGYVSPQALVMGTDVEFCQNVARSSVESFNIFLKSM